MGRIRRAAVAIARVALGAGAVSDEAVAAGRQPDARIRPEGRDWVGDNLYTVDERGHPSPMPVEAIA